MDPTYLSLFIFGLATLLYYLAMKPKLTVATLYNENEQADFTKKGYLYLLAYFFLVVISQFFVNVSGIVTTCGGSLKDNFAAGALITFVPWIFIFGSVLLSLIIFPGFKSAFSNVIGYFAVSSPANTVLSELLINTSVENVVNGASTPDETARLQKTADAITKLTGNMSVMINQIVPENFKDYWATLTPLMKDKYRGQPDGFGTPLGTLKQELLNLVVARDNIGEAMWYVYTALLLISVVQYNLATRGCSQDPSAMQAKHQEFVQQEEDKLKLTKSSQIYAAS
jgi:hypothetical protein